MHHVEEQPPRDTIRQRGSLIIFPSLVRHEVTPVKTGTPVFSRRLVPRRTLAVGMPEPTSIASHEKFIAEHCATLAQTLYLPTPGPEPPRVLGARSPGRAASPRTSKQRSPPLSLSSG